MSSKTVNERVNTRAVKYLSTFSLEEFKAAKLKYSKKSQTTKDLKSEYVMLKQFCKSTLKSGGRVNRAYKSKFTDRLYCAESIQGISKCFKGLLLNGLTSDIDIKNCHPKLLESICKSNGILVPMLEFYNNNRARVLAENPDGKDDVIAYINGSKKKPTSSFMKKFKEECESEIHDKLVKLEKFKHLRDFYKTDEAKNPAGALAFRIMEQLEVEIIHTVVVPYLESKGLEIAVVMHDGAHVYGDLYSNEELLRELETQVEVKYPGLGLEFAYKEHDTRVEIPEDFEDDEEEEKCLSDKDVAEMLFEQYHAKVIKNNEILHAYYQHGWSEDIDKVFQQWVSTCDFNIRCGSKSKPLLVNSQTHKWSHYIKQLTCICIEKLESVDLLDKAKDILPFQNGFYNFKTGGFVEHNDKEVVYFTYKVNRRFPSKVDAEAKIEIERIIIDIFNGDLNLMDEFFSFDARALSNHVEDKVGRCAVGERNSAKGFIMRLLMLAFAGVVGNVISNDLVSKKYPMP
ncbi:hypothetical protein BASA81_001449 [Batrachochytrium salamandrivorans]|nr:hypothetical protein BASA81_001449 [Batrachochytrium salamandrivorans]